MLIVVFALVALVDWWAVAAGRKRVEIWAKPLTMVPLILIAAVAGELDGTARTMLVAGAVLGLAGDVLLIDPDERRFMLGLGAFAVGHLAYAGAAILVGFDAVLLLPAAAFLAVLLGWRFATRIVPGARRTGGGVLAGAVVFYACVIATMVATAWTTGAWLAAVGAMLFAASDWVLGHQRFVAPLPVGRLGVMVPYHVGQALLIVGLATAG